MTERNIILALIILGICVLIAYAARLPQQASYFYNVTPSTVVSYPTAITNFNDCQRAGYPVTQSYPEQCRTPGGQLFIKTTTTTTTPTIVYPPVTSTGGCYVGGCSGEVCSDQPNAVSNCLYSPQFACYKATSQCTRQSNGQCGWTQSAALSSCLSNAR